jgi:hypothetical protein
MGKAHNYYPGIPSNKWYPEDLAGMIGIPHVGNVYYVDPANGSDTANNGKSYKSALATVKAAEDKLIDYNYDVVILAPGANGASQESETITWDKNYCHLIGNAAPTMIGMRARMDFITDATDPCMTISGSGCRFVNVKLETTQASNDVLINQTGDRNYFNNVMFQGITNATAGDDATARCLTLTDSHENTFDGCTFGNDTIQRSTTNATVDFAGASKNLFRDCLFMMNADNVGPVHVKSTGTTGCSGFNEFNNTKFIAKWTNKADQITANFDLSAQTNSAWIIMSGSQISIGADDWEGTATNILYFEQTVDTNPGTYVGLGINNVV